MNLLEFSGKYKPIIEKALALYFQKSFSDNRDILRQAMHYSLLSEAKRIRPLLIIAVFLLFNEEKNLKKILPLACAVEMVHTYSLIHDDLPCMDDDDYRRGRLTCHKKYGEDMAVLAGDTLNTFALEVVAQEMPCFYEAEKVLDLMVRFTRDLGIEGMAGGQVLDLKVDEKVRTADHLKQIHNLKTGALLQFCTSAPAFLEGGTKQEQAALAVFGQRMGLLFQIIDDILDVKGKNLGKSLQKDIKQNKLTYVTLFGLEEAQNKAQKEYEGAKDSLFSLKNKNVEILQVFLDYILERDK
ncbi:polyprenyl synthetase family protein [bacterium]|nr:polyprenyl synthetase family protein [bacterium]MBT3581657.1 polyprenyl synthetase family protein [bacterium]MBT4551756.1 polyprenyl synthetase family protein [bacterium]MBT5988901.1 polyprenyl synthetase family protein [bacterium]